MPARQTLAAPWLAITTRHLIGDRRMRRFTHRLLAATALAWACCLPTGALAQAATADDSLYQAWGGTAGIQAVMDDLFTRLQADARTAPHFKDASRRHLVKQLSDQLCQQAGGPCVYDGPTMAEAHRGQEISKRDFLALVEVLQQSMAAKGIPFGAQNRMLALLAPMHRDIITQP